MPITVTLEPVQTELLLQGDTEAVLTITNAGDSAVRVPDLVMNPDIPAFRIVEAKTGLEFYRRRESPAQGPTQVELAPGKSLTKRFSLMPGLHLHFPGEYLVHARYYYNGGLSVAESDPVKLVIHPVTPRALSTSYVQGGFAYVKFGASINSLSDPPQIVRHAFSVMAEGGASNAQEVGVCDSLDAPSISAPPFRRVSYEHWISTQRGPQIRFFHVNAAGEATKPVALDAPPDSKLITPISVIPADLSTERGPGRALLWTPVYGRGGKFTVVKLAPDARPALAESVEVPAKSIFWAMAAERTPTAAIPHVVVFAHAGGKGLALSWAHWPDRAPGGAAVKLIGESTGEILAADLLVEADETIHGAALTLTDPRTARTVRLVRWRLHPDGRAEMGPEHEIPWPFTKQIVKSLVRVGPGGIPAVIIAGPDGAWSMYEPLAGLVDLPSSISRMSASIDIAFQGESAPVFIVGRQIGGFEILQPDGKHLPHFCG